MDLPAPHRSPRLLQEEVSATYAGLRAASDVDAERCYAVAGGIRSTGLTSSMAVAEHLLDLLRKAGLDLHERTGLPGPPRMPNIGEAFLRPYADADRIAADPEYGTIVCFCERVTRDAFASTIPPCDMDGLRRRTRAMNGRCQGFYCGANVTGMLEKALRTADEEGER